MIKWGCPLSWLSWNTAHFVSGLFRPRDAKYTACSCNTSAANSARLNSLGRRLPGMSMSENCIRYTHRLLPTGSGPPPAACAPAAPKAPAYPASRPAPSAAAGRATARARSTARVALKACSCARTAVFKARFASRICPFRISFSSLSYATSSSMIHPRRGGVHAHVRSATSATRGIPRCFGLAATPEVPQPPVALCTTSLLTHYGLLFATFATQV